MTGHLTALTGYLTGCSKKNPNVYAGPHGFTGFYPQVGGAASSPGLQFHAYPRLSALVRAKHSTAQKMRCAPMKNEGMKDGEGKESEKTGKLRIGH
jgi:hypothetical protein